MPEGLTLAQLSGQGQGQGQGKSLADLQGESASTGSGTLSFGQLQQLWTKAGGDPRYATIMAHVAMAESGGSNAAHNQYNDGGKTYHVKGLWQISDIHGAANYADPLVNARKAVELFNAQKFGPWEDSRNKGGGGGWGKFLNEQHPEVVAAAQQSFRGHGASGKYDPRFTGVAYAGIGGGLSLDQVKQQAAGGKTLAQLNQPGGTKPSANLHTPVHHPSQGEARLLEAWDWAKRHPQAALFETLNAGARLGGAYVAELEHDRQIGHPSHQMLEHLGDAIFNPARKVAGGTLEDATTRAGERFWHLPDDRKARAWAEAHVPAQWRPYAGAITQGAEQSFAQMMEDPSTFIPIWDVASAASRIMHVGIAADRALGVTKAMMQAAANSGMGKAFAHVLAPHAQYFHAVNEAAKDAFVPRRELDTIFTPQGKKMRLSVERAVIFEAAEHAKTDSRAVDDLAQARARARFYGAQQKTLGSMAAMSPEERLDMLASMRKTWETKAMAQRTRDLVNSRAPGEILRPGSGVTNYAKIPTHSEGIDLGKAGKVIKLVRDFQRSMLFLNFLPHGFRNVGELAVLANGISSVPVALKHAVMGVPDALRGRMIKIGAMPTYTQGMSRSLYSHMPGIGPVWDLLVDKSQGALERLEEGWRAATLEHLDVTMGKSKDLADEYLKGQIVASRIGDPRNQAGFIKLLEQFGGPFVSYRLGIVPKNVLLSIAQDPSRILSLLRPQVNTQHARSKQGQSMNELILGGPTLDFGEAVTDPQGYFWNPSTLGVLGSGSTSKYQDEGPVTKGQKFAQRYLLPPEIQQGMEIYNKQAMPGPYHKGVSTYQKMSFADQVAASFLASFADYFKRQESETTKKRTRSEIMKGSW